MAKQHVKSGPVDPEHWAARWCEIEPVMREVAWLSDYQTAAVLNGRGIPAPKGGTWQANQVQRVREQMKLNQDESLRVYQRVLTVLLKTFGRNLTPHEPDFPLLECASFLIFRLGVTNDMARRDGIEDMTRQECADYQRLTTQLAVILIAIDVASHHKFRQDNDVVQAAFDKNIAALVAERLDASERMPITARVGNFVATLTMDQACAGRA